MYDSLKMLKIEEGYNGHFYSNRFQYFISDVMGKRNYTSSYCGLCYYSFVEVLCNTNYINDCTYGNGIGDN